MDELETKNIIENNDVGRDLLQNNDRCDKYDYLVAVGCGAIGGLLDVFLVGSPKDSVLGKWTDSQVDNMVIKFARLMGWRPRAGNENSIKSAIGFFERNYRVNYDQCNSVQVNKLVAITTKNHHMLSLSHAPDIVGLFFSILNQFTSTTSFISKGEIITISTETFELQGSNYIAKIFCGIANWFGHLMSDIAGSTGSRGNGGRGTGIVMPFYELFGFCEFGKFKVGKDKQDLAIIAKRAFQEGYDFRFGLAQTIPVIITDLSIRLLWALRQRFQYGKPLAECVPVAKYAELRVMLLFGNGTLCVIDGIDAGIRSGGNFLLFFTRLNIIGWFRLATLVLKEICIRIGIKDALQKNIEAFRRIDRALLVYLHELEKIDIERFKEETDKYNQTIEMFTMVKSEKELNEILLLTYKSLGLSKPWKGDFDAHMMDKNATLIFD